jgi:uncharacterized protein
MFLPFPESVDAWRSAAAKRRFEGVLPLSLFTRLVSSLADTEGEVSFVLEFGSGSVEGVFVRVEAKTSLPLVCQRSLKRFLFEVAINQSLGILIKEEDEAALPEGYEGLLASDGQVRLLEIIEDELIMALPIIAVDPQSEVVFGVGDRVNAKSSSQVLLDQSSSNPFSVLKQLK